MTPRKDGYGIVFVLLTLLVLGVAALSALQVGPKPGNVAVMTTLPEFARAYSTGKVNALDEFLRQPGTLARYTPEYGGHYFTLADSDMAGVECSAENTEFGKMSAGKPYIDVPIDWGAPVGRQVADSGGSDVLSGHCIVPMRGELDNLRFADTIVRYRIAPAAYAQSFLVHGAVVGGILLLVFNLYYRGFVYIVCGPHRQIQN